MKRLRLCLVMLALANLLALMVGIDVVLVGMRMGFERQPLYIALTLLAALAFVLFGWPVLRAWRSTWRIYYEAKGRQVSRSAPIGKVLRYGASERRKS